MSDGLALNTQPDRLSGHSHPTPVRDAHAVVIGASMAGLLAARVLCNHFSRVTLVERDLLPDAADPRKGVPQGRHLHVLHTKGEQILNGLFPGLSDDLVASGATRIDVPGDIVWFHSGGYNLRFQSGLTTLAMSRPLLESHVRRRVLELPNLTCRQRCDAVSLRTSSDRNRVTGITVRPVSGDGVEESLDADLVVDAGGRGSRSPAWLDSIGFGRPTETAVTIGYSYTTCVYRRDVTLMPDLKGILIQPTAPSSKRLGALFPIEGDRWMVTLGGYRDHHAPADEKGFLEHASELSAPDLHRVLLGAERISDFIVHGFPSNLRRHYERMERFPEGFLVMGDAICSFNPIYGQGMTVGALEAEMLDRMLERHASKPANSFAHDYFTAAARIISDPWTIAAGGDFRYTGIAGRKAPGTDLINWYVGQVEKATHSNRAVTDAFVKVLMSIAAPTSLFHPRIALRVSKEALTR